MAASALWGGAASTVVAMTAKAEAKRVVNLMLRVWWMEEWVLSDENWNLMNGVEGVDGGFICFLNAWLESSVYQSDI